MNTGQICFVELVFWSGDGADGGPHEIPIGDFDCEGGELIVLVHGDVENCPEGEGGFSAIGDEDVWPIIYTMNQNGNLGYGQVELSLDGTDLVVTFSVNEPWLLCDTHFYLSTDGTPPPFAPGQWTSWSDPDCGSTSMSFTVPLADFNIAIEESNDVCVKGIIFAFHAAVKSEDGSQGETLMGWDAGEDNTAGCNTKWRDNNWRTYITCGELCDFEIISTDPEDCKGETAWAGTFEDVDCDEVDYVEPFACQGVSNWGWFIHFPLH